MIYKKKRKRKNKKAEMICQKAQTQNAETHKATPHPFSNYVLLTSIDETNVAKAICVYFFKSLKFYYF
jgi:hypothetical protein